MLVLNYGNWTFWEDYDPDNGYLGEQKVTFDGDNKLILINEGETDIDFRTDVYSAWKEWMLDPNRVNSKYPIAVSAIGGDPLPGNRQLGSTFFIENGWRMRTWNGDHDLTVTGNFFTREGAPPFVPTTKPVTVTINLNTSTLVETILPEVALGASDISAVADAVWDEPISDHNTAGSAGSYTSNTSVNVTNIEQSVNAIPTTSAPDANTIANTVWSANVEGLAANTAGQKLERLLKLEEADEELTSNTATKYDKDTQQPILVKNVTGGPDTNTVIRTSEP